MTAHQIPAFTDLPEELLEKVLTQKILHRDVAQIRLSCKMLCRLSEPSIFSALKLKMADQATYDIKQDGVVARLANGHRITRFVRKLAIDITRHPSSNATISSADHQLFECAVTRLKSLEEIVIHTCDEADILHDATMPVFAALSLASGIKKFSYTGGRAMDHNQSNLAVQLSAIPAWNLRELHLNFSNCGDLRYRSGAAAVVHAVDRVAASTSGIIRIHSHSFPNWTLPTPAHTLVFETPTFTSIFLLSNVLSFKNLSVLCLPSSHDDDAALLWRSLRENQTRLRRVFYGLNKFSKQFAEYLLSTAGLNELYIHWHSVALNGYFLENLYRSVLLHHSETLTSVSVIGVQFISAIGFSPGLAEGLITCQKLRNLRISVCVDLCSKGNPTAILLINVLTRLPNLTYLGIRQLHKPRYSPSDQRFLDQYHAQGCKPKIASSHELMRSVETSLTFHQLRVTHDIDYSEEGFGDCWKTIHWDTKEQTMSLKRSGFHGEGFMLHHPPDWTEDEEWYRCPNVTAKAGENVCKVWS
ncbi:hypothetical protein DL96DRAFT_146968 [Flagelloscypha sp. PMI_526]|nr:hypothetical protein DL96DRAFT_146968 [Flagelloscypha sp. PMI_526]